MCRFSGSRTTTVFRLGEFLQEVPTRYCPHFAAHYGRTQRGSQEPGVAPLPPLPSRRPGAPWRHPCGRRLTAAGRKEMAATGILLIEAVRGGHSVFNIQQRAAGCFQRGPTLPVSTGRATFSPSNRPQTTDHRPVPHHAPPVGPLTAIFVFHCRIYVGHQALARTRKCSRGRPEPPTGATGASS